MSGRAVDRARVGLLAASHAVDDIYQGAVPALLPFFIADRHSSYAAATGLTFAATALSSVIQPLFGVLTDRYNLRWLVPVGLTVAGAGIGLSGLAASYPLTWLAIALSGIGVAAFHPEAARAARAASGDSQQAMSLFSVGGNAGFAAGPLFVTAVLAATSSRGTLILAVPAVITGVTVYIVLRRSGHRAACGQPGVRWAGDRDDWRGFALLTSAVIVRPIFFFGLSSLLALYVGNGLGGGRKLGEAALTAMLVAVPRGHALIDRELCLPRSWAGDRVRCKAAGIAGRVRFATKPRLARRMITRALDAGTPAAWIAGDEVYGTDPGLRGDLERRRAGYVLAVACSHRIAAGAGASRADALAAALTRSAWQRYSAGRGAKGHRCYDWAWIGIEPRRRGHRWLLIRRSIATGELAFYRCYSPRPVPLAVLARVAGRRWAVEEDFQAAKGLTGLDEHQVRRWDSWYRWTTLAMLAAAFLAVTAAIEHTHGPAPDDQIPLTRNETARLLTALIRPPHDIRHRLRWSARRRRHQHRAKASHYQRQARQQ